MAVGISRDPVLRGSHHGRTAPASPARDCCPARGQRCCSDGWHPAARDLSLASTFVCDAFARSGVRHSDHPGASGPQGCQHDDDLHPRAQPGWPRRSKPSRSACAGERAVREIRSEACRRHRVMQIRIFGRCLADVQLRSHGWRRPSSPIAAVCRRRYTAATVEVSIYRVLPTTCWADERSNRKRT